MGLTRKKLGDALYLVKVLLTIHVSHDVSDGGRSSKMRVELRGLRRSWYVSRVVPALHQVPWLSQGEVRESDQQYIQLRHANTARPFETTSWVCASLPSLASPPFAGAPL